MLHFGEALAERRQVVASFTCNAYMRVEHAKGGERASQQICQSVETCASSAETRAEMWDMPSTPALSMPVIFTPFGVRG